MLDEAVTILEEPKMRIMKLLIWISFFFNFVPNLYGRTVFVQNRIENEIVELKWIQT